MTEVEHKAVFVEGVHYALDKDGHADKRKPLRVNEDGSFRPAKKGEPLHNDTHFTAHVELIPGGED